MEKLDLQSLEAQVNALIQICNQLADENRVLRETQTHLIAERAELLEKNAIARDRIEAMIARLKSMEVGI
ncbi:MAG: TIGR02449 family protein [Thioploca sp.]|nr:TIGR02449 family protein [Thioploca sp.]